ncbi:MAG: biotin carboxylase, partial [Bacteroidota bacterium]
LGFCRFVMGHEAFRSGHFDTHFVKYYFQPEFLRPELESDEEKALAVLVHALQIGGSTASANSKAETEVSSLSPWKLNRS